MFPRWLDQVTLICVVNMLCISGICDGKTAYTLRLFQSVWDACITKKVDGVQFEAWNILPKDPITTGSLVRTLRVAVVENINFDKCRTVPVQQSDVYKLYAKLGMDSGLQIVVQSWSDQMYSLPWTNVITWTDDSWKNDHWSYVRSSSNTVSKVTTTNAMIRKSISRVIPCSQS